MRRLLRFLAGPEAMARIRTEDLHEDLFDVVAGASGGPKWLALTRLADTFRALEETGHIMDVVESL